ncbi:MAG: hypothetical protein CMQ58_02190, partial [Gammaproteobacteria bacterium]|nr:hypothetical protein [Gammaproteobacteria bacterium]
MKNALILIFTIFFIFACSTTPVEKVEVQETTTVDLTEKSTEENRVDPMNEVDVGEAFVTVYFDYDEDTLKEESLESLFTISR